MSTSYHKGIVQFAPSLYGTDDDPMDAVILKSGVANGLLHCADSMAQVRVNYMAPLSTAVANDTSTFGTVDGTPVAGTWYPLEGFPMGPWPLTLRADGTPYRLRIRAGGSLSGGAGTGTFRFIIAPTYADALPGRFESEDHIFETTTTSTSATWMTGTSQGDNSGATYIDVSRELASSWIRNVSIVDAASGASPGTVQQCLVSVWCFAKTTSAASVPRVHALHLAEYIAPD